MDDLNNNFALFYFLFLFFVISSTRTINGIVKDHVFKFSITNRLEVPKVHQQTIIGHQTNNITCMHDLNP